MGEKAYAQQIKVTCKKETFGVIENIDKKQRNKLSKLVDRYIFTVETIFGEYVSFDDFEQWEIDHPSTIGKNVVKNIKNCVKHNYNCYLRRPTDNGFGLMFCSAKIMENGEYDIGEPSNGMLHVDSDNKVTFQAYY